MGDVGDGAVIEQWRTMGDTAGDVLKDFLAQFIGIKGNASGKSRGFSLYKFPFVVH
jgi:hypothetical protein